VELIGLLYGLLTEPVSSFFLLFFCFLFTARRASEVFALVVFLCDSHLRLRETAELSEEMARTQRFFRLAQRLPMEIQMRLCNLASDLNRDIVPTKFSEKAFRKFAGAFRKEEEENLNVF